MVIEAQYGLGISEGHEYEDLVSVSVLIAMKILKKWQLYFFGV